MDKDFFLYDILSKTSNLVLAINIILYFKRYRKNSIAFKIFTNYLLFIFIIQLVSGYLRLNKENNLYLSHYYFIGQFIFLSLFYLFSEKKKLFKNGIRIILLLGLVSIGIYYLKNPQAYFSFNLFEIAITSIPLILFSFYFFIKKIDSDNHKFIYLNSGFFLYVSCSTLLFSAGNINSSIKNIIWYSNLVLYLLYQLLVFIEWYKNFRKPLKKISSKRFSL